MNANNECDFEMLLSHTALTWPNTKGLYMYYHIIVRHISTITDDTATAGDGKQRVVRHAITTANPILMQQCEQKMDQYLWVSNRQIHNISQFSLLHLNKCLTTINCLQDNPLALNIPVKCQQGF